MEFLLKPIGVIHSPFDNKNETPIQASRSPAIGQVEVFAEYVEGLEGIEGFSYIILLYILHKSEGYDLRVKPFLDDQLHGLFTTRHPCRPNPIGISIVRLQAHRQNLLEIEGVDVLDGTPLLDIKPYIPEFDARNEARIGWYENRSKN